MSDQVKFPEGFVFGTATASYQIEGAAAEGRTPSIWDVFSHTPGKTRDGDTGDVACDHYHRLDADLDLIASLNLDAYRFSLSWSRLFPTGGTEVGAPGLDFYNRLIDGLLERGITPTATLYHWDLPQELQDLGGWTNKDTAKRFGEYAARCGELFGDRVGSWITLNEPFCIAFLGYGEGQHAPGWQDQEAALRAAHSVNLAHGLGVQGLRSSVTNGAPIGVTNNLATVRAATDSPEDQWARRKVEMINNDVFTGPMFHGAYPVELLEMTSHITDWSFVEDADLVNANQPIDFAGLNWYTPFVVKAVPWADEWNPMMFVGCQDVEGVYVDGDRTDMDWLIDPSGLTEILVKLGADVPHLPIIITENGAAYDDPVVDGRVHDERRISYLQQHLTAVHKAMEAGVNVTGYYAWSLMDNFEWAHGYSKRFGLTHVDYDTFERTVKDSGYWYAELAKSKVLPNG